MENDSSIINFGFCCYFKYRTLHCTQSFVMFINGVFCLFHWIQTVYFYLCRERWLLSADRIDLLLLLFVQKGDSVIPYLGQGEICCIVRTVAGGVFIAFQFSVIAFQCSDKTLRSFVLVIYNRII